ncbi:hypothetical protein MMC12_000213 [Toensbergia leucococca]|nr:hypothetical protein [Toensbergia leucococca]
MSPDFVADVDAYYDAKTSYTDLLKQYLPGKQPKTEGKERKILTEEPDDSEGFMKNYPAIEPREWPKVDYKAMAEAQAATKKDLTQKGKGSGKK